MIQQSTFLRRVLHEAFALGWSLTEVDDGGDERLTVETIDGAMKVVKSVDIARIFLHKEGDVLSGWLFCVWQGPDESYADGEEIVSDYTINLEAAVDAACAHFTALEKNQRRDN